MTSPREPSTAADEDLGVARARTSDRAEEAVDGLLAAERAGLRLATLCRSAGLLAAAAWAIGSASSVETQIWAGGGLAAFGLLGLAFRAIVGTSWDKPWMKYALATLDYVLIGLFYALVPLSLSGDVSQIQSYRSFGALPFFVPIALATLSLSPGLVAYCGGAAVASLWGAFLWIVSGMERTVSWADLEPGAGAERYYEILLDRDFIGVGNRVIETLAVVTIAGVLALAVRRARRVLEAQIAAEAERAFVARAFGEYVPAEAARLILRDRAALAPQTRRASVVSVDVAGFTTLAEQLTPAEVLACLNAFFTDAAEHVAQAGGVIVDFSGDGFLAAFNAPIEVADPETRALDAARDLLAHAATHDFAGRRLSIRVGVATGEIAAGSVGGGGRRTYTVYGDVVNLAARLQEMAKSFGVALLADEETARASAGEGRRVLKVMTRAAEVRGRRQGVNVFSL